MIHTRRAPLFFIVALLSVAPLGLIAEAQALEDIDVSSLSEEKRAQLHDQDVEQAKVLYKEGKFQESLELFERAYLLKEDPKLLFNMGIISERLGNLKDAVDYYDKFVLSPGLGLKARSKGQERLEVLRPIVDAQRRRTEEKARLKRQRRREQEEAQLRREQLAKAGSSSTPPEQDSNLGLYTGYAFVGAGAIALGVGGFMLFTLNDEMAFTDEPTPDARRQARDQRQTNSTLGIALTSSGALMVGLGVTIWALSSDDEPTPSTTSWQITPAVSPTQAGMLFRATF